jgi:hypothetical protein
VRENLEQFDGHGLEVRDDLDTGTLGTQGGRVAAGAGVHAGNDRAEGRTKGISRGRMVDIGAHNNLTLTEIQWKVLWVSQRQKACDGVEGRRWLLQAWH